MALLIRTVLVLFVFAASAAGASAAEAWRVVASTGVVKTGAPGATPVALNPKQDLPTDSWVATGASGRAVLARGPESIAVGPNSRVMLPSQPVNGNTQVLQTMGSALYQIGKQKAPHFQVDTPYLAAVVKGTTFLVSVSEGVAAVDVTEGLVQVATPDGADSAYVQPGYTGYVTRGERDKVVVAPTAGAPKDDTPSKGKAGPVSFKDTSSTNERVIITQAVGELSLDVKTASGGLVSDAHAPLAGGTKGGLLSKVGDVVKNDKDGGAAAGVDAGVASVDVGASGGGVTAGADVGGAASVDVSAGGGVSVAADVGGAVGVDVGLGNGNGNGNGGASVDVSVPGAGVGVDLGVGGSNGGGSGSSNGNGNGGVSVGVDLGVVGVDLTLGNSGTGLGVGGTSNGGGSGLLGGLLGGRH